MDPQVANLILMAAAALIFGFVALAMVAGMVGAWVFIVLAMVKAAKAPLRYSHDWTSFAEQHGFALRQGNRTSSHQMSGEWRRRPATVTHSVHRRNNSRVHRTQFRVALRPGTLRGWKAAREHHGIALFNSFGHENVDLDDAWVGGLLRIRSIVPEDTRVLLSGSDLTTAITAVHRGCLALAFQRDTIELTFSGQFVDALAERLDRVSAVADALEAGAGKGWQALSDEHRMVYAYDPASGSRLLEGTVRGMAVSATYEVDEREGVTTVRVPVSGIAELRVEAGEDGPELSDPILDGRVVVSGMAPDDAMAVLSRDTVRGNLMQVLLQWRGRVERGEVVAEMPTLLDHTLAGCLTDVLDLAEALSAATASRSGPRAPRPA